MIKIIEYFVKLIYTSYVEKICYNKKLVDEKYDDKYNEKNEKFKEELTCEPTVRWYSPLYLTGFCEKIHMSRNCSGLRKRTSRLKKYEMCILCTQSSWRRNGSSEEGKRSKSCSRTTT